MNYADEDTRNWLRAAIQAAIIERDGQFHRLSLWFVDHEQANRVLLLIQQLAEGAPSPAIDVVATPARTGESE